MNVFLYILIGIIILAAGLYAASFILKKNHYGRIDELEKRKIELMDIPVIDEINLVKNLNLTGQTERTFESWNKAWQNIANVRFPDAENLLFEAEQATDKLQLNRARTAEEQVSTLLEETAVDIDKILKALKKLTDSEEDNRTEVKLVRDSYQEIRKKLLTQSFAFGGALENLENQLSYLEVNFAKFSELTNNGDHIEAREILDRLKSETAELKHLVDTIPEILKQLTVSFEEQTTEIKNGYDFMVEQNYCFNGSDLTDEMKEVNELIEATKILTEKCEVEAATENIEKIEDKIDHLYEVMQVEIDAKRYVVKEQKELSETLVRTKENNRKLLNEIDMISQSYSLVNGELESANEIESKLTDFANKFDHYKKQMDDQLGVYSNIADEFKVIQEALIEAEKQQEEIYTGLNSLRKDELAAKKQLDDFEFELRNLKRYVEKQHLPGLSNEYKDLFFTTGDRIETLDKELNRIKINMKEISKLCFLCEDDMNHLKEKTEDMVDAALLTEYMIQYSNRYRHQNEEVEQAVKNAMNLFSRGFAYQDALETISTALEAVEPGAFKKVEDIFISEKRN